MSFLLAAAMIVLSSVNFAFGLEPLKTPGGKITGDAVWSGLLLVEETAVVPLGARLTIEPGTTVYFRKGAGLVVEGGITAAGTADKPLHFALDPASDPGAEWSGVRFEGTGGILLSFCRLSGAEVGISIRDSSLTAKETVIEGCGRAMHALFNSQLTLERCLLKNNRQGIQAEIRTLFRSFDSTFEKNQEYSLLLSTSSGGGTIKGNSFSGGKYGIVCNQAKDLLITGNTFSGFEIGMDLNHVGGDVRVTGNLFEKGGVGLFASRLAMPLIACCRFIGLEKGVLIYRFSNPLVSNNLFDGNGQALSVIQKCSFPIRRNIFRNNRQAIFLDLSSYVTIHENNFTANARDIVLGPFMNAEFEQNVGSDDLTRQQAEQNQSRNVDILTQPQQYTDTVDARHNWWGPITTQEMEKGGGEANISTIDDRHDLSSEQISGTAERPFGKDRVIYEPWEKAETAGVGPLPGECGDSPEKENAPATTPPAPTP